MSAPETNVKKQEKRHSFPLWGMVGVIAFARVLLVGMVLWLSAGGNEPGDGEPVADSASAEASE